MSVNIEKIQHIKIPVSNLLRSASWYARLLDLDLAREFVEEGVVRGVTLLDRDAGYDVSLRDRDVCSGNPRVADFDVVAFKLRSREALSDFLDRCVRLGVTHGDVQERGLDGAAVDVVDPDGAVLRFLALGDDGLSGFTGVEFGENGAVSFYDTPRLRW